MLKIFKRSCTNWEEFSSARKTTITHVETEAEARKICHEYNDNRTPKQIERGTKYEYTDA